MKQLIYCVIIAMSISLAFSKGKPCCNKKAGKNVVACKYNQATLSSAKDAAQELTVESTDGNQKSYKCCTDLGTKCVKSIKQPWWKFWTKQSSKNCPCKQANATEATSSG